MIPLLWSVRTFDGRPVRSERLVSRVLSGLGPGDIVLLHDVSPAAAPDQAPAAVEALPAILAGIKKLGLEAVTVSELLGVPGYLEDRDRSDQPTVLGPGLLARTVAATFAVLALAAAGSAFAGPPGSEHAGMQEGVAGVPDSFAAAAGMLAEHSTVQARFTQTKTSNLFVDAVIQQGLLQLRRSDRRLLWSYDEGARLLLAEGRFYSLDASDGGAGARRLPAVAARMAEMMEALFFLRLEVLEKHFEVSDEGRGLFVLRSRRAGPKAAFRAVRLQIAGDPLALQRVVIEEKNGDTTQIEFSEVQLGRELPEGLFLRPGEGTGKP